MVRDPALLLNPRGGYYAHLRVRYPDGTRGRETLYGKSNADVRKKIHDRRAELERSGAVRKRDRTTVAEFLERWLRDAAQPGSCGDASAAMRRRRCRMRRSSSKWRTNCFEGSAA